MQICPNNTKLDANFAPLQKVNATKICLVYVRYYEVVEIDQRINKSSLEFVFYSAVNSQRLLCNQKAGVICSY